MEWEEDPSEIAKIQERHEQAEAKLDAMVNFEEKFQQAYLEMAEHETIQSMHDLLQKELPTIAGDNFNYVSLYFERILAEYTQNNALWNLFVGYTEDLCKKKEQKLQIYEKAIKNCQNDIELRLTYFRELEKNEAPRDTIQEAAVNSIDELRLEPIGLDF